MRLPDKFTSAKHIKEYTDCLLNEFPTLYWGLEGIADNGWFWFKRRTDEMYADIICLEYWGA